MIDTIVHTYQKIKPRILEQTKKFQTIRETGTEVDLFWELAFCLLTPQSKARMAEKAIANLRPSGLVESGRIKEISGILNIVRFKNNKASYLVENWKRLSPDGRPSIRYLIDTAHIPETRLKFQKMIIGIGMKEASHFLRNIGYGQRLAILDRHILNCMVEAGLIPEIPKSLTPKKYNELETTLLDFAGRISIPADHLDFVLWYIKANDVFK